jgi:hypothetical protein
MTPSPRTGNNPAIASQPTRQRVSGMRNASSIRNAKPSSRRKAASVDSFGASA